MNETNNLIKQVMPKFREEWLNRENMTIQESLPLVDDFCSAKKMQGETFEKFEVIFIQHLLGPFIPRIKSMKNCGLKPEHSWIVDIPYSTNKTVYKKLSDEMDFNDEQILDTITEPFHPYGVTQLGRVEYVLKEIAKQENGRPILVIDDGGWVIRELVRLNDEEPTVVKILSDRGLFLVEQTTKGHRIFEDMPAAKELIEKFEIPIISIAKAKTKKIVEMPFIGESIGFATKEKLEKLDRVDKNLGNILVIGYGPVGKSTAMSLKGICSQNEKIHVFDTEPKKKDEIGNDGFVSLAEIDEKIEYFDAVFGCTGFRSFNVKDTSILRDDAILSSGSSATVEFNRREFLELSNDPNSGIHVLNREYTRKSGLHSDISLTDHNKKFTFLNGSFPINFQPEYLECVPHWIIQSTHALLIAGANEVIKINKNHCRQKKKWFFHLNDEDDNWILEKSLEKLKEKI